MDQEQEEKCQMLMNPISAKDLIGQGAILQMNPDCDDGIYDELCEEVYGTKGDSDEETDVENVAIESPWLESFEKLKTHMEQVDKYIYKRIIIEGNIENPVPKKNARVSIRYSSYFEGERKPFDSTLYRREVFSFEMGQCNVIEGLELAVSTMLEGEEAEFVIGYQVLFGKMGSPPRIKECADALYVIELISFKNLDIEEEGATPTTFEQRQKFKYVIQKAKELHSSGLEYWEKGMFKLAVNAFTKAAEALELCVLANEEEEKVQVKFLLKLYTNLSVLHNKLNQPQKTCIVCRKIWKITNNRPSCKALFHQGRALLMLGDYERSKSHLKRALRIEPNNVEVQKELETLNMKQKTEIENNKIILQNLIGVENAAMEPSPADEQSLREFKENMRSILESSSNSVKISLPPNLTEKEIDIINDLTQNLNLKLSFSNDDKSYSIVPRNL